MASLISTKNILIFSLIIRRKELCIAVHPLNQVEFYREISECGYVWYVRDKKGIPAPKTVEGDRSMPFWSNEKKVLRIIKNVPTYAAFEPQKITLKEFKDKWLPGLEKDELLVGLNWGGKNATGYDVSPQGVKERLENFSGK